ncbi:hypothetical protein VI34_04490 [Methylophilales bacterium MBRSG12]|uniref:Uncharacterized protein n=1 Tax=Methylophilales bacterium MBRS-H7 TaxID=1623450 RepID=A0A0H4J1Q4_9PROT|nr:hypothetical protein UZ34_05835 [Methylophilales bacterium MBRSF5]AKO65975.1 hypothetical protein VI33_04490 [Methylophilales bacterium MBRS-H7]AKO67295.1 hypothetical protein VI34_04490 [Methylophilales bacterium MBRSG12]
MINFKINTDKAFYYRKAMRFDVYKLRNAKLKKCINNICNEMLNIYKQKAKRVRNIKERKHACFYILLNLWKAYYLTFNPWVSYSRDKNKYNKGQRLNKLHFKYEAFIQTHNDLVKEGLIINKDNVHFPGYSFTSRMKASKKLIKLFDQVSQDSNLISSLTKQNGLDEIVIKNKKKQPIKYRANRQIKQWRENLITINNKLLSARICLDMENDQYLNFIERLNKDRDRVDYFPDFTSVTLHRVFNNSSINQGGRFFGGWWQSIPREYRKFIDINYKPTEEVDYSGHHIRIMYSLDNKNLEGEPYEVEDESRNTQEFIDERKIATLVMLNCSSYTEAHETLKTMGYKSSKFLMNEIIHRHEPIKDNFFTGIGNKLMNEDSKIAEEVMLRMIKLGHVILPVHDSFIVRNSATFELKPIMEEVFNKYCKNKTILKTKETSLEWNSEQAKIKDKLTINDENFLEKYFNNRTIVNSIWDPS